MSDSELDISFVLITLNEEQNLPRTLSSLPAGAEVIVVDSGSTDRTVEIAEKHGARVHARPFSNYADQKNGAVALATRSWVFSLDADEVLDLNLKEWLCQGSHRKQGQDAYRVTRRLVFMGRTMRFGGTVDHPVRLFRAKEGRFEGAIHESLRLSAPTPRVGLADGALFHHSYRDLTDYFVRFNRYTSLMAEARPPTLRRFVAHLFRPWIEFVRRYVVFGGFLDGYPGYVYALVSSLYGFMKYAKAFEKTRDHSR